MQEIGMQDLLRQAPFGYAYHKLDLNSRGEPESYVFLDVNPAFEEMTGLKREAVIGKRVTEVIPGIREGNFDWVAFYGVIALEGKKQQFTQFSEHLGRWYKITVWSPEKGYFITIFHDITSEMENISKLESQKKEIERLLRDSEMIFNGTQDAMFLVQLEKGEFRYIKNNLLHQKLTGISQEDLKDKTPVELLGEENGKFVQDNYRRCLAAGTAVSYEEDFHLPAGRKDWLISLTPVVEDDEIKYLVGSRKDITLEKEAQKEREDLLQRLHAMFTEHSAVMLIIEPVTGKIMDANPAACVFYGYSRKELLNKYIQDINMLPKEEVEKQRLMALKEKQKDFLFPHRLKSGEIKTVDVYSCSITHKGEKLLFSIIFDVTEKERYKDELYREKELLRSTLFSIGDGVVTTDNQGRISSMNKVAERITGWTEEEAKGASFTAVFKLISEVTGKRAENPVSTVLKTGRIIGLANHTLLINKKGEKIPIADSAAPIKDEKGNTFGIIMVFRDVSQEKEHQDRILYLSYHDALTGLYNRRVIEEELVRLNTPKKYPLAVIMGDVNGLKLTNDVFGHETGDNLIKKAANIIMESCRKDDIIARWGGDEFLILLPKTNAKMASKIIERIKNRCAKDSEKNMQLSIALGFAIKETTSLCFSQILKEAEESMYRRKLLDGKSYRNAIINSLLATLFEKSVETEEHAERLKSNCLAVGRKLKLSGKEMDELSLLSVLHDIGKVGINENVLKKCEPLTFEEWEEMKKHPEIGYRIAQNTPELSAVAEYILSHHERLDGKGYPRGLKGKKIPLLCRILSVADAYDAMTNTRIYRDAMSKDEAIAELRRNAGTQFDPVVVESFLQLIDSKTQATVQ